MPDKFKIIIAGGKTGGHLFPGIAVAQALESASPGIDILFVGTDAPFEVSTLKTYGYAHKSIASKPIKGGSLFDKAYACCMILVSLVQSLAILVRFKPDFVLGVGGFSSFALVLAARLLKIQTAVQEQNCIPGMTNRVLSKFTDTIFTAFESTENLPENKTKFVGNPIREQSLGQPGKKFFLTRINPDDFFILVTGGSQGASSINTAFVEAIRLMDNTKNLSIVHQTGIRDESKIQKTYKELGTNAMAQAFFHDMPTIQDRADLVITRAGAGTISEITGKGLPAILIPFPHAADDHQTANARALEKKGAAILIADQDLSGKVLNQIILDLKADKKRLEQMAIAAKQLAMPDAAKTIAAIILSTKDIKE